MDLITGMRIKASQPAHSFDETTNYPENVYHLEILPKPSEVICCDGATEEVIPLPEHLAQPEWHHVLNLVTLNRHWFCFTNYDIEKLND